MQGELIFNERWWFFTQDFTPDGQFVMTKTPLAEESVKRIERNDGGYIAWGLQSVDCSYVMVDGQLYALMDDSNFQGESSTEVPCIGSRSWDELMSDYLGDESSKEQELSFLDWLKQNYNPPFKLI